MSLYVFALSDIADAPDSRLLSLLNCRINFENVFYSPECVSAGSDMALYLGANCVEVKALSLKKSGETEREYTLRVEKEGGALVLCAGNNILLLPPQNVKILCGLKQIPPSGYSEVIDPQE